MARKKLRKPYPGKSHGTGPIGRRGQYQRRQLDATVIGDRAFTYHATKGWRSRAV